MPQLVSFKNRGGVITYMQQNSNNTEPPREVKNWIEYLSQLGPSASKNSLFEEQLSRTLKKLSSVTPINIETELEGSIQEEVKGTIMEGERKLILLAGMAGDGKTTIEASIWRKLATPAEQKNWEKKSSPSLDVLDSKGKKFTVKFIKDLSAESSDLSVRTSLLNVPDRTCLIVACNHGRLLDKLREDKKNTEQNWLAESLEKCFFEKNAKETYTSPNNLPITLFDLSIYSPKKRHIAILKAILGSSEWSGCSTCKHCKECPILANRNLLWNEEQKELTVAALRQAECIELIECSGIHLPTRDLLMVASNNLLGTHSLEKKVTKKQVLTCSYIFKELDKQQRNTGVGPTSYLVSNLLGENLPLHSRKENLIFREILKLDVGGYAPRAYDSLFNSHETLGSTTFKELSEKLPTVSTTNWELKSVIQRIKRQNAFFFISDDKEKNFGVVRWRLSSFSKGANFFKILRKLESLQAGKRLIPIPAFLINGMNKAFTGQFRQEDNVLYLTTAGGRARTLLGELIATSYPGDPIVNNRKIVLVLKDGVVKVVFLNQNNELANFDLTPSLFEFFSKMQEGFTFSSFTKDTVAASQQLKVTLIQALSQASWDNEQLSLQLLGADSAQVETISFTKDSDLDFE